MASSVYELFLQSVDKYTTAAAVKHKQADRWVSISWRQLQQQVESIAAGLINLGIQPGDRVAIVANTRLEWTLTDLAIWAAGGCGVPIYHSNTPEEIAFILQDSGAKLLFVEDEQQLQKVASILSQTPELKVIVSYSKTDKQQLQNRQLVDWRHIQQTAPDALLASSPHKKLQAADLATIVYTSGTTGRPRGAMITHHNLLHQGKTIEQMQLITVNDVQLLFLPLSHIFARFLEIAWLQTGHLLVFAENMDRVIDNMQEVNPTMMACVPRVFEKVRMRVMQQAASAPWLKSRLIDWAVAVSAQHAQRVADGQVANLWQRLIFRLAHRLVLQKMGAQLRERFGGNMRFFVSGGAPLSKKVGQFFEDIGVVICEGYGLTETTAPICFNLPNDRRVGTVGKVMPGTRLRIADDGEILARGDAIFTGYWHQSNITDEVFSEGWLCTGDVGHIDQDGFVYITDRKKDLIVTAGGKNIAPQKVEMAVKANSSLIGHAVVYGDKKPFLTALIVLEPDALLAWAQQKQITGSYQQLTQHAAVRAAIQKSVTAVNQQLPRHEQIKQFAILDHDLVVGQQLTPTLKVKRGVCYDMYKSQFDQLYQSA